MDDQEQNEGLQPTGEPNAGDTAPDKPPSVADDPEIAAFIELKVQEGIQKALQGVPPRVNTADPTEQQRTTFERMTYRERLSLFNSDPAAYNKLTKGAM